MIAALGRISLQSQLSAWLDGLAPILPAWAMNLIAGERRVLRMRVKASVAEIRLVDKNLGTEIKLSPPEAAKLAPRYSIVLEIPQKQVLTREVSLPDAALRDLDSALRLNIGVWTPFSAADVYFSAMVSERKSGQARIQLHVIPKATVERLLEQLPAKPDRIELYPSAPHVEIDAAKSRRLRRPAKIDLALAVCALAFIVLSFGVLSFRIEREMEMTSALIREEIGRLKEAEEFKKELAAEEQRIGKVALFRAKNPQLVSVIGAIAEALPANARVVEFSWTGREGRVLIAAERQPDFGKPVNAIKLDAFRIDRQGTGENAMLDIGLRIAAP